MCDVSTSTKNKEKRTQFKSIKKKMSSNTFTWMDLPETPSGSGHITQREINRGIYYGIIYRACVAEKKCDQCDRTTPKTRWMYDKQTQNVGRDPTIEHICEYCWGYNDEVQIQGDVSWSDVAEKS
jgi:hypothetical protein